MAAGRSGRLNSPGVVLSPRRGRRSPLAAESCEALFRVGGRGASLLLNLPPDRRGQIHPADAAALKGFRQILEETFDENLLKSATFLSVRGTGGEHAQRRLRRLIANHAGLELEGVAGDGRTARSMLRDTAPDIVFMDIEIPELDGFAVLSSIEVPRHTQIVFTTAHHQYAIRAFECGAIDYLLKPFEEDRFRAAVARCAKKTEREPHSSYSHRILGRSSGRLVVVQVPDIEAIQAQRNNSIVFSGEQESVVALSLKALEERLDPKRFFRVQRSTIVNADHIVEVVGGPGQRKTLVGKSGRQYPTGRAYRSRIAELVS